MDADAVHPQPPVPPAVPSGAGQAAGEPWPGAAPVVARPAEPGVGSAPELWSAASHRSGPAVSPSSSSSLSSRARRRLGPFAGVVALLAKFGAVLIKLKSLVVVGSMAVSVAAYASIWGWKFAVGFVLLIFVHEIGHVIVLRARGIKASAPVFLPFLGAFVSMKSQPRSAYEEAESALAGPLLGTVGALLVGYVAHLTGSDLLRSLAFTGLLLNLFNLLPALPLDGGRVAGALHPGIWLAGLVALLGYEIYRPSPVIPILLVLGGYELYQRWRNRASASSQVYFSLRPEQRIRVGTAYLGLILVIGVGMHLTYVARTLS